jgi:hypothetical protein
MSGFGGSNMADTTKTGTAQKAAAASKKQIVKSPHWPVLTFTDALAKAKIIYNQEKRNATTADVMLEHLGFKKRTGPANRTLGALRSYGLIEKVDKTNFKVSDKAWRIIVVLENGTPEMDKEIRDAALRPKLIKEIVGLYPDGLPSDAALRTFLVGTKGFNENTYGQFLKVLKAAINVAKPYDGGYTPSEESEEDSDDPEEDGGNDSMEGVAATVKEKLPVKNPPPPPPPSGQLPFPLYLSKDQKAMLYVPSTLTAKEFELLKKQIENSFLVMEATILAEENGE